MGHKSQQKKDEKVKKLNEENHNKKGKLSKEFYEYQLIKLQEELVKLQYWVKDKGLKIVIIFEGMISSCLFI